MIRGIDIITVFSENPRELAQFYQSKVGLPAPQEAEVGDGEELFLWNLDSCDLGIMHHSKVQGKNPQPARMIINFEVDDIEKAAEKTESAGVKKIQDTYHVEGYGYIATFEDPDGNYFQLVQVRPSQDEEEDEDLEEEESED